MAFKLGESSVFVHGSPILVGVCSKGDDMTPPASGYQLTRQTASLWGKSDYGEGVSWLPLFVHMYDSSQVARMLWDRWVPRSTREVIARPFEGDENLAKAVLVFLAGVHDIGKATPEFQFQKIWGAEEVSGLDWKPRAAGFNSDANLGQLKGASHAALGTLVLERWYLGKAAAEAFEYRDDPISESYFCIVGNHHGKPPMSSMLRRVWEGAPKAFGLGLADWEKAQDELIEFMLTISGASASVLDCMSSHFISAPVASLLVGLVIMSDWIASNQDYFPLLPLIPETEEGRALQAGNLNLALLEERASDAWESLRLTSSWSECVTPDLSSAEAFASRFDLPAGAVPRPVQLEVARIAGQVSNPGLMVVEAPMGEGKTEAALAAAETLAARTGRGGVLVALPTMATTDAMFGRVHAWLRHLPIDTESGEGSVYLAHGKAVLNEEFRGIVKASRSRISGVDVDGGRYEPDLASDDAIASDWLFGRKKGMLANFVVCTIDQVLMGALQMRHLALRHLALANKVIVLDECHAYDAYMQQYLREALEWLGSWRTPVVLLSATLPDELRVSFVESYVRGWRASGETPVKRNPIPPELMSVVSEDAYPRITYTDDTNVWERAAEPSGRGLDVHMRLMADEVEELVETLESLLKDGGCAGVICDTVKRAQDAAEALSRAFPSDEIMLVHARYTDIDRMDNERRLREVLGSNATRENGKRPYRLVVIGTQVLEQSLDIDFDVLISDVAPVDLLFQRIGRMHRHYRGKGGRPANLLEATCYVRGIQAWLECAPSFSRGVRTVYAEASLMEALAVLGLNSEGAAAETTLPESIAPSVRLAYSNGITEQIPLVWRERYGAACDKRGAETERKRQRARACLLASAYELCWDERSLADWYSPQIDRGSVVGRDDDRGQRAVRDTQETVEVLVLCETDSSVCLLPWVGDEERGVARGEEVPTAFVPRRELAMLVAQSAVRLPLELCRADQIDRLIDELEDACCERIGAWQESEFLAGSLVLFMHEVERGVFAAELCGRAVHYSRDAGLSTHNTLEEMK